MTSNFRISALLDEEYRALYAGSDKRPSCPNQIRADPAIPLAVPAGHCVYPHAIANAIHHVGPHAVKVGYFPILVRVWMVIDGRLALWSHVDGCELITHDTGVPILAVECFVPQVDLPIAGSSDTWPAGSAVLAVATSSAVSLLGVVQRATRQDIHAWDSPPPIESLRVLGAGSSGASLSLARSPVQAVTSMASCPRSGRLFAGGHCGSVTELVFRCPSFFGSLFGAAPAAMLPVSSGIAASVWLGVKTAFGASPPLPVTSLVTVPARNDEGSSFLVAVSEGGSEIRVFDMGSAVGGSILLASLPLEKITSKLPSSPALHVSPDSGVSGRSKCVPVLPPISVVTPRIPTWACVYRSPVVRPGATPCGTPCGTDAEAKTGVFYVALADGTRFYISIRSSSSAAAALEIVPCGHSLPALRTRWESLVLGSTRGVAACSMASVLRNLPTLRLQGVVSIGPAGETHWTFAYSGGQPGPCAADPASQGHPMSPGDGLHTADYLRGRDRGTHSLVSASVGPYDTASRLSPAEEVAELGTPHSAAWPAMCLAEVPPWVLCRASVVAPFAARSDNTSSCHPLFPLRTYLLISPVHIAAYAAPRPADSLLGLLESSCSTPKQLQTLPAFPALVNRAGSLLSLLSSFTGLFIQHRPSGYNASDHGVKVYIPWTAPCLGSDATSALRSPTLNPLRRVLQSQTPVSSRSVRTVRFQGEQFDSLYGATASSPGLDAELRTVDKLAPVMSAHLHRALHLSEHSKMSALRVQLEAFLRMDPNPSNPGAPTAFPVFPELASFPTLQRISNTSGMVTLSAVARLIIRCLVLILGPLRNVKMALAGHHLRLVLPLDLCTQLLAVVTQLQFLASGRAAPKVFICRQFNITVEGEGRVAIELLPPARSVICEQDALAAERLIMRQLVETLDAFSASLGALIALHRHAAHLLFDAQLVCPHIPQDMAFKAAALAPSLALPPEIPPAIAALVAPLRLLSSTSLWDVVDSVGCGEASFDVTLLSALRTVAATREEFAGAQEWRRALSGLIADIPAMSSPSERSVIQSLLYRIEMMVVDKKMLVPDSPVHHILTQIFEIVSELAVSDIEVILPEVVLALVRFCGGSIAANFVGNLLSSMAISGLMAENLDYTSITRSWMSAIYDHVQPVTFGQLPNWPMNWDQCVAMAPIRAAFLDIIGWHTSTSELCNAVSQCLQATADPLVHDAIYAWAFISSPEAQAVVAGRSQDMPISPSGELFAALCNHQTHMSLLQWLAMNASNANHWYTSYVGAYALQKHDPMHAVGQNISFALRNFVVEVLPDHALQEQYHYSLGERLAFAIRACLTLMYDLLTDPQLLDALGSSIPLHSVLMNKSVTITLGDENPCVPASTALTVLFTLRAQRIMCSRIATKDFLPASDPSVSEAFGTALLAEAPDALRQVTDSRTLDAAFSSVRGAEALPWLSLIIHTAYGTDQVDADLFDSMVERVVGTEPPALFPHPLPRAHVFVAAAVFGGNGDGVGPLKSGDVSMNDATEHASTLLSLVPSDSHCFSDDVAERFLDVATSCPKNATSALPLWNSAAGFVSLQLLPVACAGIIADITSLVCGGGGDGSVHASRDSAVYRKMLLSVVNADSETQVSTITRLASEACSLLDPEIMTLVPAMRLGAIDRLIAAISGAVSVFHQEVSTEDLERLLTRLRNYSAASAR